MAAIDAAELPKMLALTAIIAGDTDEAFTHIAGLTADQRTSFAHQADTLRALLDYSDPRCGQDLDGGRCNLRPDHGQPCTP